MKKYILPVLYALVAALMLANCVREIDFQEDDADQSALVVSGTFTDGNGPHILRLSRPGNYDKQRFSVVTGATVRLRDDLGNVFDYQEITPTGKNPFYQLSGVKGQAGRTYTLEITLPTGEQYRSHPQVMPEPLPLDTLEVLGKWYYFTTADGVVVREPDAFAYARTKAPAQPKNHYLHWESEATYTFDEISPKSYYAIPPPSRQCFVNSRINDQIVAIADLNQYEPGGVVYEQVGRRKIDFAFAERIAFAVYQRSVNRETYEYWKKVNQLLSANGTIFDVPPAAVPGNVENATHPEQPALGYFEVGAADTSRIYLTNGQLGNDFLLQNVPYCMIDYRINWPPVNHPECDDCLNNIDGSTYEKPWWWH